MKVLFDGLGMWGKGMAEHGADGVRFRHWRRPLGLSGWASRRDRTGVWSSESSAPASDDSQQFADVVADVDQRLVHAARVILANVTVAPQVSVGDLQHSVKRWSLGE